MRIQHFIVLVRVVDINSDFREKKRKTFLIFVNISYIRNRIIVNMRRWS